MPKVVTCLLIDDKEKLLILKRSEMVKTYKGQWGGVAGYIEEGEKHIDTAYKELNEETSLNKKDVQLIKILEPFKFTDFYMGEKYDWEIYVFVFKTKKTDKIHIDWEHIDFRWITPSEIYNYDTVPKFKVIVSKILL
jgi:8-oxo-dGTP pyrophosphatase MutT (NUDIX family)